jgi:two-component system, cell cycle sensor histidine kinase and response regulator CckA
VPTSRKTILVIEDIDDFRKFLCNALSERGFNILEARNGKEGLQICQDFKVDVVCTDVIMPVMDGIEFYKQLQQTAPHLKVVFTSAASIPTSWLQQIPPNSFIEKTPNLSILVSKLEESLGVSCS